jgi:hypothetical protein
MRQECVDILVIGAMMMIMAIIIIVALGEWICRVYARHALGIVDVV